MWGQCGFGCHIGASRERGRDPSAGTGGPSASWGSGTEWALRGRVVSSFSFPHLPVPCMLCSPPAETNGCTVYVTGSQQMLMA